MKKITLTDWNGESKAKQNELLNNGVHVTTDDGSKVLFGTASPAQSPPAPTNPADPMQAIHDRLDALGKMMATPAAPPTPPTEVEKFLNQVKGFQGVLESMKPEQRDQLITREDFDNLGRALKLAATGNTALLDRIARGIESLGDDVRRQMQGVAAYSGIGVDHLVEQYTPATIEQLTDAIDALDTIRWAKMDGWQKALYYGVNYGIPLLLAAFTGVVGAAAGGGIGFAIGRLTAPAAEVGSDVVVDVYDDGALPFDATGTNG